jgi:hypothetical protein
MMRGQINKELGRLDAARQAYSQGVCSLRRACRVKWSGAWLVTPTCAWPSQLQKCPYSIPLWLLYARLEKDADNATRARSILEKARLKNPGIPQLWCVCMTCGRPWCAMPARSVCQRV